MYKLVTSMHLHFYNYPLSLGLLVIVLLISSWIHYSHAVKLQEKQHRRKQMSDTVASSSSAGNESQKQNL